MDCGKAQLLRLFDIFRGIINEQTFMRWSVDSIEHDLKDLGVWLDVTDLPRDDHVIEQVEEVMPLARVRKGLGRPVA